MHPYSLTYGQYIICFYMKGLGDNFTMKEVVSSANSCANCHYDIYQDTFSTWDTQYKFPWLYINYSQSPWFQCIIIESGIFPWWVVSRGGGGGRWGGCLFLKKREDIKKGGWKKKGGGEGSWYTFLHHDLTGMKQNDPRETYLHISAFTNLQ